VAVVAALSCERGIQPLLPRPLHLALPFRSPNLPWHPPQLLLSPESETCRRLIRVGTVSSLVVLRCLLQKHHRPPTPPSASPPASPPSSPTSGQNEVFSDCWQQRRFSTAVSSNRLAPLSCARGTDMAHHLSGSGSVPHRSWRVGVGAEVHCSPMVFRRVPGGPVARRTLHGLMVRTIQDDV